MPRRIRDTKIQWSNVPSKVTERYVCVGGELTDHRSRALTTVLPGSLMNQKKL